MGIRLFSAVIMSHPAGIPNNIRFTKMFRPLIEKKKETKLRKENAGVNFGEQNANFVFRRKNSERTSHLLF